MLRMLGQAGQRGLMMLGLMMLITRAGEKKGWKADAHDAVVRRANEGKGWEADAHDS